MVSHTVVCCFKYSLEHEINTFEDQKNPPQRSFDEKKMTILSYCWFRVIQHRETAAVVAF